jgi:hypothetical protein
MRILSHNSIGDHNLIGRHCPLVLAPGHHGAGNLLSEG